MMVGCYVDEQGEDRLLLVPENEEESVAAETTADRWFVGMC